MLRILARRSEIRGADAAPRERCAGELIANIAGGWSSNFNEVGGVIAADSHEQATATRAAYTSIGV